MFNRKALVIVMCLVAIGLFYVGQALCQQADPNQGDRGPRARGNFDPNQMRQRMMDFMKEQLGATDEEWKALEPKADKVMTLSNELRFGGFGRGFGRGMMGGRRGGRDGNAPENRPAPPAPPAPTTEVGKAQQALSAVLENNEAKAEDIKTALQNFRDARTKAKTELEAAQKDLREVLTVRQEAQLVMMGYLD